MDFKQRLEGSKETALRELPNEQGDNMVSEYFAKANMGSLPACLDLRLQNGRHKALPYSYFTELNFDNDSGIEIFTNTKRITITGRHLDRLFDYLVSYRVRYIQVNIGSDPGEDGLFVKDIMIEEIG